MTAAFSAMSFIVGVAGDLSAPAPSAGASVLLRIPPKLPPGIIHAQPLAQLPRTPAAQAEPLRLPRPVKAAPETMPASPARALAPALVYEFAHELSHGDVGAASLP